MKYLTISFLIIILFNYFLLINTKVIHRDPLNETLLVGQIHGPLGGAAHNLLGMILSMNVFLNETILHSSIRPITNSTFPINYSLVLNDVNVSLENIKNLDIVSIIWQPAYIYDGNVELPGNNTDALNLTLRTIKFVIIRGEIVHDKHEKGHDLAGTQVKLELIEDDNNSRIVDQVDFLCTSKKYPCPFEYWLDTSRIKGHINYKLEAILANHILPVRKSIHQKYQNKTTAETKSSSSTTFKINPNIDTEINSYIITVVDV